MWADIMARVCGQPFASEPASLAGHRRHPVLGEDYPGLRPAPDSDVRGVLYRGVDAAAWARLDAFEGAQYERASVLVTLADGNTLSAQVYRFRDAFVQQLLPGDWDVDAFAREGRTRFMARYAGFAVVGSR
ncbi:MAG: gamma-glutamylcyclotransferase [Rubrivivax sp.]|nr:MAG: gamma-glutamylcyclotransferase [Rubrivivax sp.]